jgi:hypothetical protein
VSTDFGDRLLIIILVVGTSKMIATFQNASNNAPIELLIKGDWFDRSANITMGNVVVATISRSFVNMGQIFGDKQTVSCLMMNFPEDHC